MVSWQKTNKLTLSNSVLTCSVIEEFAVAYAGYHKTV